MKYKCFMHKVELIDCCRLQRTQLIIANPDRNNRHPINNAGAKENRDTHLTILGNRYMGQDSLIPEIKQIQLHILEGGCRTV